MSKREPLPYIDRGNPGLRYVDGELPRVREPVPIARTMLTKESRSQVEPECSDANAALEHWAAWAKSALSGMGWPEKTLLARVIEYGVLGAAQRGSGSLVIVGSMVEYDELCAWVEVAVIRLAVDERDVIACMYLANMPAETAAKNLGITRGTFDSRLSRARRSVKDYLDGRKAAALALQGKAV